MLNGKKVIESPSDQSEEDKKLVSWVTQKLEGRRSSASRAANEAVWLTNIAYLCGIDSVQFDAVSKTFKAVNVLPRSVGRSRVHVNKILPTAQNRLAKLCKNQPKWDVRPQSSDDEHKEAARLGKAVILHDWDSCKIGQKRPDLLMWKMQCGHSYLKVTWDETLGPVELKKYKDESGKECVERVTLGDKRVDVVSAFEVFPDELAKSFSEVRDIIHAQVRPLSYFVEHYELGHLVKAEDTWVNSLTYEARVNTFSVNSGGGGASQQTENTAIEISYYEKPSKKHPLGRHIIVANGVKLKDGILPIDEIPLSKFDDIKIAGKYNSESFITHIRPMQDQYNRNKTMKAAFLNRMLAGKYIAARGHGLSANALNDQSGEVVEYDPVPNEAPPQPMQVPQMPQYVFQEDEQLIEDINDVSGVNQVSRGQLPSSSIPAIGMQMLVEQDDTRIGVETEADEYAYADVGRILLKFTAKYVKAPRLLKEVGKNFDYIVKSFKGEDLKDNFDVHVIRGSTVPGSKVLEREAIMNLHERGYFGKQDDPKVLESVLSMLEFGDEFEAWKKQSLVKAQIQKGINLIEERSEKPACSEFDNHTMWIQELDEYRLSDRFDRLSDAQKGQLIECMNDHVNELQRMVAPQTMDDPHADPELVETNAAESALASVPNPETENPAEAIDEPDVTGA